MLLNRSNVQSTVLLVPWCLSLEAFMATGFNEMLLGRQLHQDVKVFWYFRDRLCPHLQSVPETSENLHILTWLSAHEHFIVRWCFMVWKSYTPSATNTASFGFSSQSSKKTCYFAKLISPLQLHSSWTQEINSTLVHHTLSTKAKNLDISGQLKTFWSLKRRYVRKNPNVWSP
jgi:hypothetical protein